jgi:hypothetical protein
MLCQAVLQRAKLVVAHPDFNMSEYVALRLVYRPGTGQLW